MGGCCDINAGHQAGLQHQGTALPAACSPARLLLQRPPQAAVHCRTSSGQRSLNCLAKCRPHPRAHSTRTATGTSQQDSPTERPSWKTCAHPPLPPAGTPAAQPASVVTSPWERGVVGNRGFDRFLCCARWLHSAPGFTRWDCCVTQLEHQQVTFEKEKRLVMSVPSKSTKKPWAGAGRPRMRGAPGWRP